MPKLIYFAITSVDGFIEDEHGKFDWAVPDDDAHSFVNDLVRAVSTFFYGRRMYETMRAWENVTEGQPVHVDFAGIWRAAHKVVFSRTLEGVSSERTRLERELHPDVIRSTLAAAGGDGAIGGAEIAAAAFGARLIDELHLLIAPYAAGAGKRAVAAPMPLRLELRDERRFPNGMVYLKYDVEYTT